MPAESKFVEEAMNIANKILVLPLYVDRKVALLYQITIDRNLSLNIKDVKHPKRGRSAFETDLCILEKRIDENNDEISIPRVVMEFKTKITTHDVLTYSAKARKHKDIYPYLRYGIVASDQSSVPGRLFTHNESLDFCACVDGLEGKKLSEFFTHLLEVEIASSKKLEDIAFGAVSTRLFRNEISLKKDD